MNEVTRLVRDIFPDDEMDRILEKIASSVVRIHSEKNIKNVPNHGLIVLGHAKEVEESSTIFEIEQHAVSIESRDMVDFSEKMAQYAINEGTEGKFFLCGWLIGEAWVMPMDEDGNFNEDEKSNAIMIMGISVDGRKNVAHIECSSDRMGFIRTNIENVSLLKVENLKDAKGVRLDTAEHMLETYFDYYRKGTAN